MRPTTAPSICPALYVVVVFVLVIRPTAFAGGYQNEFPVVTHGWSEKVRGRQGERTTTPQNVERSTKNQAPDILEYLLTKFLRSITGIRPHLSCCLATRFW
jgi:hypothetical protein